MRNDDRRQGFKVDLDLTLVKFVIVSNIHPIDCQQSSRQTPKIPLCTNIWARPQQNFHTMLFSQFQKPIKILVLCGKVKLASL